MGTSRGARTSSSSAYLIVHGVLFLIDLVQAFEKSSKKCYSLCLRFIREYGEKNVNLTTSKIRSKRKSGYLRTGDAFPTLLYLTLI